MTTSFTVAWDYRCPFARNAHEHVLAGLADGADWDVRFLAFSLSQIHVEDGDTPIWDDPAAAPSRLAMEVGIAVRDRWPDAFRSTHRALFAARHDSGLDIRDETALRKVLDQQGLDADEVLAEVASGRPLATFRAEHEEAVRDHGVWGVPTFIADGQAVFVRLMHRPGEDTGGARRTIERVLDLLRWPDLNEFKHTTIPR